MAGVALRSGSGGKKEGFSIPAQSKLLRDYAAQNGFRIVEEYIDVETAKSTGRTILGVLNSPLRVDMIRGTFQMSVKTSSEHH